MAEYEALSAQLQTNALDFSFGEIINLHRDSEIIISPEYQRLFRWNNVQKSRLIESILVELPIPPIFLIENDDGILELIDGLQRVSSVIQFISPEVINREPLILDGCDLAPNLNGLGFDDLRLSDRLRIKRTAIRAVIIRKQGNPIIKYDMFKRLNTGGSLLSEQEIRNCSSRMVEGGEKFYSLITLLASDAGFTKSIDRLPDQFIAMKADEELVLRYFAVKNYIDGYHGNVKEWLDNYMEGVLFNKIAFDFDAEEIRFRSIFAILADKFERDAFARHKAGVAQGRLAPAYFEAAVGAALQSGDKMADMPPDQAHNLLASVYESAAFKDATGPGANTIEKLRRRIELVATAFQ